MTDNFCNKIRYRILNDNTFFLTREILLKTIMAVHRFGICSSVWCRAKLFDLDQAAFRSGCPHCSFMYESFPKENLMTFETSTDRIQHAHPRSLCIGAV